MLSVTDTKRFFNIYKGHNNTQASLAYILNSLIKVYNLIKMKEVIGIIAASLVFIVYTPYLRDILSGKSRPHPYSWFVWGLNTVIIFALQLSHGAGAGSYTTATVAAMCFVICILAARHGTKDITRMDTAFLITALLATVVWLFAKQPTFSMVLLITIDMLGIVPSVRKAWYKPGEETLSFWTLSGLRHVLAIVALQKYSLITLLNPLAQIVTDLAFSLMLISRRRFFKS